VHIASDQHVELRQRSSWFRKGLSVNLGPTDVDSRETVKVLRRREKSKPTALQLSA
jgi:deoxycytidine triphosphate deaminase